ncbi:hypothetical protein ABS71_19890 [bacterium SCN 62-11]|nr:MAG: hypothetical protein ABS71_19890 [bacterium SCN 62-11]
MLLSVWAWARPTPFSDGPCRLTFPASYRNEGGLIRAAWNGNQYLLRRTPVKTLDPAQHLANLRRTQLAQRAKVQLLRVDGLNGLEVRRAHFWARVFVVQQTAYQAEVRFAGQQPGEAAAFLRSLRFQVRSATAYVPQRMARYDTQIANVPLDKCAENLLAICSLLTGYRLKHKKYPQTLAPLADPLTRAYGYRRSGNHFLLFCSGHHHRGIPAHYPRSDDALHTMLTPAKAYRPGY